MDLGLKDRVALVTAASRGLGRAVAEQLGREGARVALCARGAEALHEAAAAVKTAGAAAVLAEAADVRDDAAVRGLVMRTEQELGPIELLLVNAGGPPAGSFADTDLSDWEAAYRLNLESALRLCRLVLPGMMSRGWGRIVQITSVAVLQPVENLILSNVIRPAVHALTRSLALEAAPCGVTVNSVAPGFHLTAAVERLIARKMEQEGLTRQEVLDAWAREIPAGRLGRPEELAALVLFLMSRQAAYLTGQILVADGGWVRATF
jgi:3-oxoacyl-[acyl-carrier protein] reductase